MSAHSTKDTLTPKLFSFLSLLLAFTFISDYVFYHDMYQLILNGGYDGPVGDPKAMAEQIALTMATPLSILFLAFPGWLCAMGVLLFSGYQPSYLKKFWLLSGIALLVNVPFGVLFGLILLVTLYIKRERKP